MTYPSTVWQSDYIDGKESQMDTRRYQDRVALVTGAARGIGAASARRLAEEGASVLLTDVQEGALRETTQALAEEGRNVEYVVADAASAHDWEALRARVLDRYGRLDLLHSNAYVDHVAPLADLDPRRWDHVLAVSLTGAYHGVRAFLSELRSARGAVVLTSSVHAHFGLPGHPAYAAAKGGLCALGRQLAVEYAPEVRVNTVLPGPILTPAWDRVSEEDRRLSVAATPAGRFGEASEVAAAVAFLGSHEASFITGQELVVDGGWSVMKSSS